MNPSDHDADRHDLLNILFQSDVKLTTQAFIREIKAHFQVPTPKAKKMLQQLVEEQEVSYHYLYGATYVEQSFSKPVQVTEKFILTPPVYPHSSNPDHIEVVIEPGIAFGSGQHPTTRLCLQAIERCFFDRQTVRSGQIRRGADIGTGSGVLAIAMCLSGLQSCTAYDIDPVSVNEAKKSVALNRLTQKINVIEGNMDDPENTFSVITANLRLPTLKRLSGMMYKTLVENGIAIISGVREWEKDQFIAFYTQKGFELAWQADEKKWSGFVWVKKIC